MNGMIFLILGSQKFQFNRLLKAMDELCEKDSFQEVVYAQTGYSDYRPKNYNFKSFLNRDEFVCQLEQADIVITHGGTGAIVGAIKKGKKVIAIPRLRKYQEHVDDHQLQVINQFSEMNLILKCEDCDGLEKAVEWVRHHTFVPYESNTQRIVDSIEAFIDGGK